MQTGYEKSWQCLSEYRLRGEPLLSKTKTIKNQKEAIMPSRHELNLRARAVGLNPTTIYNDSKLEQKVLWLEKNATAISGTAATGTLTSDNTNVANGETVTIGDQTYTFKTALTPAAYEVLIGASADDSLTNLEHCINMSGGTAGTDYAANTPTNKWVTAGDVAAHAITVTAINKDVGNATVATTETSAHLSWGGATLSGGAASVLATGSTIDAQSVKDSVAGLSGDRYHF